MRKTFWFIFAAFFVICVFLKSPALGLFASKPSVDYYVVATSASGGQPCLPPGKADYLAVAKMVKVRLSPWYSPLWSKKAQPPDYLAYYLGQSQPSTVYVVIATFCRMLDVDTINIAGYVIGSNKTISTGSLGGTFDALETSDWSGVFGTQTNSPVVNLPTYPNVAFVPVANDTTGIVNARLVRNLPVTVMSTPAPLPTAPPAPGSQPAPAAPSTRLAACQASAYRMLIVGRSADTSQSTDFTRVIVATTTLSFTGSAGWNFASQTAAGLAGVLFVPNSAQISADVFYCPPNEPDKLYWLGGENHHITGWRSLHSFGLDPYSQRYALDLAISDLNNQLYCVVKQAVHKMNLTSVDNTSIESDNDLKSDKLANSYWCNAQFAKLDSARFAVPTLPINDYQAF
jgi:hypothetical protein